MTQGAPTHDIQITPEFERALDLLEHTRRHASITGRAGTGKSTLLQHFRETTQKSVAVLAPTGVAAVNVAGETIHAFFRFRPDVTPDRIRKVGESRRVREAIDADDLGDGVFLTTTNRRASEINRQQLDCLRSPEHIFLAQVSGEFEPSAYPTEEELHLKEGARVMLLNNDPFGRWVNGTMATVSGIDDGLMADVKRFAALRRRATSFRMRSSRRSRSRREASGSRRTGSTHGFPAFVGRVRWKAELGQLIAGGSVAGLGDPSRPITGCGSPPGTPGTSRRAATDSFGFPTRFSEARSAWQSFASPACSTSESLR